MQNEYHSNMPILRRFTVEVWAEIEVEAKDEDEACTKAIDQAVCCMDASKWTTNVLESEPVPRAKKKRG